MQSCCNLATVSNFCTNFCTTIYSYTYKYVCIYVTSYIPSSLMPGCKTLSRMKSPDVWRLRAEFSWRKRCTSSASNTMLLTSSNPNIQEYLLIFLEHFTSINAQHPSTDCSTPFNRVSCITFNKGLVFCGLNVWKGLLNQIENVPHQQILWYWQVLATIYYVVWLYAESQQSTYCSSGAGCKYQEKLKSKHQHTASEGCGSLDACDMCYSKSTRCGSSWCFCSSCSSQLLESRLLF